MFTKLKADIILQKITSVYQLWKRYRLIRKESKLFKPYKSIEFCPFWNFFKVLETNDARYILRLENYETLPETISDFTKEFETLSYQYQDEMDSIRAQVSRRKVQTLQELRLRMSIIANCITILSIQDDNELREIAATFYPKLKELEGQKAIDYLLSQFKGLKTKYNMLNYEQPKQEKKIDLYEIINAIEQYKGYNIDVHELTVKKFITLQKNFEKWANAKQAQIDNHGRR